MSLSVILINKTTNDIINKERPNILIDEVPSVIKEKLFGLTEGVDYIPNLLQLELQIDKLTTITDNFPILSHLDTVEQQTVIYITNVFDIIETEYNVSELYEKFETDVFDSTLAILRQRFVDLTERDLEFVIKVSMLKTNPAGFSHLQSDIEEYITSWFSKQSEWNEQYTKLEENLQIFYNKANDTIDYNPYLELSESGNVELGYSNVSFLVRSKNFETGVRGKFIKLLQIYNQLELDDTIPFIAIQERDRDPIVKVYNKILNSVSAKEVKSWILNEKKKRNILTYKKIRGLMLKYKINESNYATVNLTDSGLIYVKVAFSDPMKVEIGDLFLITKQVVNGVVDTINRLQGIFTRSRRLDTYEDSETLIESISCNTITRTRINREQFAKALSKTYISEHIFELKDTLSEDVLSIYYKKTGRRETDETSDVDRKGLTINIRDNPYQLDSSVVNIFGAYNTNQIGAIMMQIVLLDQIYGSKSKMSQQKIKERSHIKTLRKQGVTILSTKCQKPRQPELGTDKKPIGKSYILDFDNMKYVCTNKDYPYPGFTNENIVCCFKKDQRRRPAYIRNMKAEDFDILVQPSNLKIKVRNDNNELFETYAIKVVSDYMEGFDEENAMSRYYYISSENKLVAITNQKLIDVLNSKEEQNIWLESVPLAKIITEPPKNKCNYPPDTNAKRDDDINAPCAHHDKNNVFGYNLNSYPCCFDKERETTISRKKKVSDITKQHILISDKILDYQRIGILPYGLDKLFNETIKLTNRMGKYYRMGVVQNKAAFFNAVLLGCENVIGEKQINNSYEFRRLLTNYLTDNSSLFKQLNNGNIANKYGTLDAYNGMLVDTNSDVNWNDVLDIIQRVTEKNIIILDIPYKFSESTKIADYENMRILCHPNVGSNPQLGYIVLLKRLKTFELVVCICEDNRIEYTFKNTPESPDEIIQFLVEYDRVSCVRENIFPETYPYDEMYTLGEIVALLQDSPHQIIAQIVNKFNKVDYVLTQSGLLIPIKESGIIPQESIRTLHITQLRQMDKLASLDTVESLIQKVNKNLVNGKTIISIIGITKDGQSILTNYGRLVPIKITNSKSKMKYRELPYKYYENIDDLLFKGTEGETEEYLYNQELRNLKNTIYVTKVRLAREISSDEGIKDTIIKLNTQPDITRFQKLNELVLIFKKVLKKEPGIKSEDYILQYIANEVLSDNVENLLLNNLITSEVFNPDEIIQRDSESLLANIGDIQKWIQKYANA